MASDLEEKAQDAFIDDNFELAVDLYSQAIEFNPNRAELFTDRAQANIKLRHFTEAVADANRAIELDSSMWRAYLRKGIACLKLEEYQTAKTALETGASLEPGESRFIDLIKECDKCIAECLSEFSSKISPKKLGGGVLSVSLPDPQPVSDVSSQATVVPPAKPRYRHEFYQKPEVVVISIFAKGVPPSCVSVDYGEQILSFSINIPEQEECPFQPLLFGKRVPANCKYAMLSTKIEIRLSKAERIHWTSLEYSKEPAVLQMAMVSSA